ncbi:MAG: PAC2 family protein [Actinobacteria bacterium]|nr:PAC2 family protein [Actinomycetota bacterium]MSX26043.1 PAC2 family protein [Actinomycetota bacterium]MSY05437.1 PAC2 family protein [Actinomycetota bacterium]MSY66943.1 PAC2 family protein [Actinomycetota bacterium]MSZ59414.1 PAC2 family protein [Actinomycetota bacterium]
MEILGIPELRSPIMILAFSGWNDAGEAASAAVEHLASIWPVQAIGEFDTEEFYDYQNNRPIVSVDESFNRSLTWPTTTVRGVSLPNYDRDLILVSGVEPSLKWRSFVAQLLDLGEDLDISMVVCLGSLLADVPHTRPIPVTATAARPEFGERLGLEMSRYEGPTGILGAIQDACNQREIDALSIWAAIPHYVSSPPCPKATLSLLNHLEDLLELPIDLGELPEDAKAWEIGVDQLSQEDSEIADYVKSLEESKDEADLPEATGEAIAREFERYLRRRGEENPQA